MCGIAGFCISQDVVEKIEFSKLLDASQFMADENLHRGSDASGFFVGYRDKVSDKSDSQVFYWKREGMGTDLAENMEHTLVDDFEIPEEKRVPNVLGIHTRAKSSGFSEKDEINNHPVTYRHALAIHNGMISNHTSLKLDARSKWGWQDVPNGAVDSLVIPVVGAKLYDPLNEDDFKEWLPYLTQFEGGWAFHMVWTSAPAASLLVSGPRYPLVLQYKKGVLAYSSEADITDEAFKLMGNQFPKNSKQYKLEPGHFILVNEGEVVSHGSYDVARKEYKKLKPKHVDTTNTKKYRRYIPAIDKWWYNAKHRTGVTISDKEDVRAYSIVDHNYDGSTPRLLYDKTKGLSERKFFAEHTFATKNSNAYNKLPEWEEGDDIRKLMDWKECFEVVCEADRVYAAKEPDSGAYSIAFILYAWFDMVEVAVKDTGTIIGIYNWGEGGLERPVFKTPYEINKENEEVEKRLAAEREEKLNAYTPILYSEQVFSEWLKDHSLKKPTESLAGERIIGGEDSDSGKARAAYGLPIPIGMSGARTCDMGDTYNIGQAPPSLYAYYEAQEFMGDLDERDIKNGMMSFHASTHSSIPFLWNQTCDWHVPETLETHSHPLTCDNLLVASVVACSFLADLDAWRAAFPGPEMLVSYTTLGPVATTQYCNVQDSIEHTWRVTEYQRYPVWGVNIDLIETEKCDDCKSERTISQYPLVIRMFTKYFDAVEETIVQEKMKGAV